MKNKMLAEAILASLCMVYFTGCKLNFSSFGGSGSGSGSSYGSGAYGNARSSSNCTPIIQSGSSTATSQLAFSTQCNTSTVDIPESSPAWYVWPMTALGISLLLKRRFRKTSLP